ncbi:TPA: hypothetical protein DDW35_09570 [Candidatus Sumerlaeota bacterium]|jgi:hemerythrin-like metal-binding protein|nr:hypothetical protein [Candidatus Sumerlaeota bacterium]
MPSYINWDASLELDLPQIDNDHRELVKMVNRLQVAMEAHAEKGILADIFSRLTEYATTHFKTEEQFMAKIAYSDLQAHIQLHRSFVVKIFQMTEDYLSDKETGNNLLEFLKFWWVAHIKSEDYKYLVEYRNKKLANKNMNDMLDW